MGLSFSGERDYPRPATEVFARLADMRFLVDCLPDLHEVGAVGERTAEAVLRPGFSFARGEMKLTAEKVAESPPESATYRLSTKGIGTSSVVETTLRLADRDGGSRLVWSAEVKELGGLMKAVPSGLIRGAAERVIGQLLTNVGEKLGAD